MCIPLLPPVSSSGPTDQLKAPRLCRHRRGYACCPLICWCAVGVWGRGRQLRQDKVRTQIEPIWEQSEWQILYFMKCFEEYMLESTVTVEQRGAEAQGAPPVAQFYCLTSSEIKSLRWPAETRVLCCCEFHLGQFLVDSDDENSTEGVIMWLCVDCEQIVKVLSQSSTIIHSSVILYYL